MRAISGFLWKTWWCLQYPPLPTSPGDGREILQWRHLGSFVCGPPPRHRSLCQPGRFRGQKWGLADLDRLGVTQLPRVFRSTSLGPHRKNGSLQDAGSPSWRWTTRNSGDETECGQPRDMHHPLDQKVLQWRAGKSSPQEPESPWTLCQPGKNLLSAQLSSPLPHCLGQRKVDLKIRREVSMKAGFPGSPVAKGLGTSRSLGLGEVRLVEKFGNGLSHGADFFNYWIEIVL